jgi:hypothetical protein
MLINGGSSCDKAFYPFAKEQAIKTTDIADIKTAAMPRASIFERTRSLAGERWAGLFFND